jgi:DNA invertase Pin-like site-specific DNA recombinase
MPMKAAIYGRTSREDKASRKVSIDIQVDDGRKVATRDGLTVEPRHVFIDRDLSGKLYPTGWTSEKKARPAFGQLIKAIENNEIQAVIVQRRDRIARNTILALKFFEFCQQHNVALYFTHENITFSNDASGKFGLTVLVAAAQMELDKITERNRSVRKWLQANKRKTAAVVTVGYKDGGKGKIDIDPEGAELVKKIYALYLKGKTFGQIVDYCKQEFPFLHPPIGKTWYRSTIQRILTNSAYIGQGIQSQPRIIEDELFNETQKQIAARANTKWGSKLKKHLLSGFIRCGYDGEQMQVYTLYKNNDTSKPVGHAFKCCKKHNGDEYPRCIRETHWDACIEFFFATAKRVAVANGSVADLEIKRSRIETNLKETQGMFASGDIDGQTFREMTRTAKRNLADIDAQIAVKSENANPLKEWSTLTLEDKRQQLHSVIDGIRVFNDYVIVKVKPNIRLSGFEEVDNLEYKTGCEIVFWFSKFGHQLTILPTNHKTAWQGWTVRPDGKLEPTWMD